jgi:hypothetical protein
MAIRLPDRLPVRRIATGTTLYRTHSPRRSALYFGPEPGTPPTHRFHAPDGSYRTCFIGLSEEAAFAEGVLHGPVPTAIISPSTLNARSIAELRVLDTIRALPLYGRHLMKLGATATVTHGDDYATSQAWGKAIHAHPQALDGIVYTSRHDDTTFSLALFDRAAHKLAEGDSHPLSTTDLRTLLLLDHYGLGLES